MLSNSRATTKPAERCSTSHEAQARMFTTAISTSMTPQAQNHTRTRSAFNFNPTLRDEGSIWQGLSTMFPDFLLEGLATKLGGTHLRTWAEEDERDQLSEDRN